MSDLLHTGLGFIAGVMFAAAVYLIHDSAQGPVNHVRDMHHVNPSERAFSRAVKK